MKKFEAITREELKKLEEQYGDLFYKAYKSQVMDKLDRRERIDKLLDQNNEKQDNSRYGHLLDKYIK